MYDVDKILIKNNNYHKIAKYELFCTLVLMCPLLLLALMFDGSVWTIALGRKNVYYIHYYVDFLIDWTVVLQFMACVKFLKDRFQILNDTIGELLQTRLNSVQDATIHNLEEHLASLTRAKCTCEKIRVSYWTHKDILRYNLAHDMLCEAAKLIISIYEIQIFLSTICCFLSITLWLYFGLCYFYGYENTNGFDVLYVLTADVLMAIVNVIKLACICLPSYKANCEIGSTVTILRKLLLFRDIETSSLREIQNFLQQAVLRQFKLSALGFLNLDLSLFCSVIGGVITYLVILQQFLLSSRTTETHSLH